jgi:hypothetical protein
MATMTIQLRGDTAANWTTANPVLAAREMGIETDTKKFKFGNGTTAWTSLAYVNGEISVAWSDITGAISGNSTLSTALSGKQDTSAKGAASGYVGLNASTKVDATYLPDASATAKGIIEIATDTEATTGTSETLAVNPKQLKASIPGSASTTAKGLIEIATDDEATAGTSTSLCVTPKQLKAAIPTIPTTIDGGGA